MFAREVDSMSDTASLRLLRKAILQALILSAMQLTSNEATHRITTIASESHRGRCVMFENTAP